MDSDESLVMLMIQQRMKMFDPMMILEQAIEALIVVETSDSMWLMELLLMMMLDLVLFVFVMSQTSLMMLLMDCEEVDDVVEVVDDGDGDEDGTIVGS